MQQSATFDAAKDAKTLEHLVHDYMIDLDEVAMPSHAVQAWSRAEVMD